MRQLVGAVAEFVFVVDRGLRIIMANRGVGERSAKQLEGALVTDLFPQSLHARALSTLHRVLANGQVDGYVAEIEGNDGQSRHFDVRVSPIRDEQKIVALAVVTTGNHRASASRACHRRLRRA